MRCAHILVQFSMFKVWISRGVARAHCTLAVLSIIPSNDLAVEPNIFHGGIHAHNINHSHHFCAILFCICSGLQFDAVCLVSWKKISLYFLFVLINWRFQLHSNYSIICWLFIQFSFVCFFRLSAVFFIALFIFYSLRWCFIFRCTKQMRNMCWKRRKNI